MPLIDPSKFAQILLSVCGYEACSQLGAIALKEALGSSALENVTDLIGRSVTDFFSEDNSELNSTIQKLLKQSLLKSLLEIKSQYPNQSDSAIRDLLDSIIEACSQNGFRHVFSQKEIDDYLLNLSDTSGYCDKLLSKLFIDFKITVPEYEISFISYFSQQIKTLPLKYYREGLLLDENRKANIAHNIIFQQQVVVDLYKKGIQLEEIHRLLSLYISKASSVQKDESIIDLLAGGNVMKFGVEYLYDSPVHTAVTKKHYRDYTDSKNLPYVSREEYLNFEGLPETKDFITERTIVNALLNGNEYKGVVIHGEGGIGKTRLMKELGYLLKYEGCLVLSVKKHLLDTNVVNDFVNGYLAKAAGRKLVLLFDYIEEHNLFNDIVEEIFLSGKEFTKDIRFIANCRKTYDWQYTTRLGEIALDVDVSITKPVEANYKRYVIGKIIEPISTVIRKREDFFEKRPAFAVFVRYLHENYTDDTEILDTDIEFGNWLFGRLALTVIGDRKAVKKLYEYPQLFNLFAIMPVYGTVVDDLRAEKQELIEKLLKDGWLELFDEDGQKTLKVVQDTITDQLLTIYFKHYSYTIESSFENLFQFSVKFGVIKGVIVSLDRISDQQIMNENKVAVFNAVNKLIAILSTVTLKPGEYFFFSSRLAETKMVTEDQRLNLIADNLSFFSSFVRSLDFGYNLSFAMNFYSKQTLDKREPQITSIINNLLYNYWLPANKNFINDETLAARIFSTYFKFYRNPVFPDGMFEKYLSIYGCSEPGMLSGSYILPAWFKANGDKKIVNQYLLNWLSVYSKELVAYFVYRSWLDTGGDNGQVGTYIKNWLTVNGKNLLARHVYQPWLDSGGEKDIVKAHIERWLTLNDKDLSAGFVYESWLDSGGEKDMVKAPIERWLTLNNKDLSARSVYRSWLDSGGDRDVVEEPIKGWLTVNDKDLSAAFVYKSWLDFGGDKDLVKDSIESWLTVNGKDLSARYVYQSWLDSGGDRDLVKEPIESWLTVNNEDLSAQFVYSSWLDCGGEIELVEDPIVRWLSKNGEDLSAAFVYQSWLDSGGNRELVKEFVGRWLSENGKDLSAAFVYQSWLDSGGDRDMVKEPINSWLTVNDKDLSAQFVYKGWLDSDGDRDMVKEPIKSWLTVNDKELSAQFVYSSWLGSGGDKGLVETYIKNWLTVNDKDLSARFIYKSWLDSGGDKDMVKEPIDSWLAVNNRDLSAQFLYSSWLESGGDKGLVETYIKNWLTVNDRDLSARFVYKSWLDSGGDRSLVKEPIESWLTVNSKELSAQFVYSSWLDSGGDNGLVETYIIHWLTVNDKDLSARFIYKSWLDSGGDRGLVKESIYSWLTVNDKDLSAAFVYQSWLDSGGDRGLVKESIDSWLTVNGKDLSAAFVYKSWLDSGGDTELVQDFVKNWLAVNDKDESAQFVFHSWLKNNGELIVVYLYLIQWLDLYPAADGAYYIYNQLARQSKFDNVLKGKVIAWLQVCAGLKAEYQMLVNNCLRNRFGTRVMEPFVVSWLANFAQNPAAFYVYLTWINVKGDISIIESMAEKWIEHYQETLPDNARVLRKALDNARLLS